MAKKVARALGEEQLRLKEAEEMSAHWRRWGPYLAERQWGTVREDYSPDGSAWDYFSHHDAVMRAYRWGEDGIAGISDNHQKLCCSLAVWNGEDQILKERLFGLTWSQGNHGESVKESYYYLDSTPTHSYMKYLYRYPYSAFPYQQLLDENKRRTREDPEFEIGDTGVFDQNRYFDVVIEYAKDTPDDLVMRVTVTNKGDETRVITVLPQWWFRNTWSWTPDGVRPKLCAVERSQGETLVSEIAHPKLGLYEMTCYGAQRILVTENDTNGSRLYGQPNGGRYFKDAFHRYIINGELEAVNPLGIGTKAGALYQLTLDGKESKSVLLRLAPAASQQRTLVELEGLVKKRSLESDEFYAAVSVSGLSQSLQSVQRQAFAGMLWTKQFYHYVVEDWLNGDPTMPSPPPSRKEGRNSLWGHLYNDDILSMPDKWEYPWFASWDTAFHLIPLAMIDPDFAKRQLILLTREWYMHPNGQIPAYEWDFNDVTPPVHAWAAYRVFKIERRMTGRADRTFLERVFQKLLLNFTWWVNRKDPKGQNVFQGGFLGLDNIGVFDRSKELPTGGQIKQSDSTSWMAMYCLNMLVIAIELAKENPAYEDIASKFFEHFLYIASSMNHRSDSIPGLWDEQDGFYYDILHLADGSVEFLKVRSLVGLIPLCAVLTLEPEIVAKMPGFKRRMEWFMTNRPELLQDIAQMDRPGQGERRLLALVNEERFLRILGKLLDPGEFLSPFGIRSLSKFHQANPYIYRTAGQEFRVDYEPGESTSTIYGGNSNWRGPIWWPLNYLIIESIQRFSHYYGDSLKVECPTGSGNFVTLWEVSTYLSERLLGLFNPNEQGSFPFNHGRARDGAKGFHEDNPLFYEYFHAETGKGLGASHQTGWTGLVAKLIQQSGSKIGYG